MYLGLDSAAAVRFLASVREGRGLKPSAGTNGDDESPMVVAGDTVGTPTSPACGKPAQAAEAGDSPQSHPARLASCPGPNGAPTETTGDPCFLTRLWPDA